MMKLPLIITVKEDGIETEFDHSVVITEEEYDFMARLEEAEANLHEHPWRYLHLHAPLLEDRIEWDCFDAVKKKFGKVLSSSWRGAGKRVFQPTDPSDTKPYEEDVRILLDCELLLVTVGGVTITDENIIGCHACQYYEYDTSPRDASGFYRMDCDTMDYDVFGRNTVSVNERAKHARSFRGGYYLKEKTLSVEYFDDDNHYQQVTQIWKYDDAGLSVDGPHTDKSLVILDAIRRSLLAISKKSLSDKRHELRNRAVKIG